MRLQLLVQLAVGAPQLDATGQKAVGDGVLSGQDVVLDVVALPVDEDVRAGLLRVRCLG